MTGTPWDGGPPRDGGQPHGGQPYGGPPQYGPPQYGPPQYGQPPYGQPPYGPPPYGPPGAYGPPPWGWAPGPHRQQPARPGTAIAAAVLAFVSAVLVLFGTVYALAFSALLRLSRPDAGMGLGTALLHLALVGLLIAGGLRVLNGDRRWLLAAAIGQLLLALGWLTVLVTDAPATLGDSVRTVPLVYGTLAAVAAGLVVVPDVRAWTARRAAARAGDPRT